MADSAEFDVIMHGVDDGATELIEKEAAALNDYNQKLTEMAQKEAADNRLRELKEDFASLTEEQKAALIAADEERNALEALGDQAGRTSEKTQEQSGVIDSAKTSFEELNQGLEVGRKAYELIEKGVEATIVKFVEYAEEVKKVSDISGQSSEEASRFIQVLQKYGVTVGDIESATKKLTGQGLSPNKDTIIELAEKYQALTSPVEKNKLMFDNFGRSGEDLTKILNTNTEELSKSFDEVNAGLVLNDKQIAQAEQLKIANEQLGQSWNALAIKIGSDLAPAANNWITTLNDMTTGQQASTNATWMTLSPIGGLISLIGAYSKANDENTAKLAEATEAEKKKAKIVADDAEAVKAAKEAADALNQTLTTEISLTGSIQSQSDSYAKSTEDIAAKMADAEKNIKTLISQGYSPLGQTVIDAKNKYHDLSEQTQKLSEENAKAMAKMRIDNLQAKLAVDGISDADYNLIIAEQEKAGIITEESAKQAVAINTLNTMLAAGKISQENYDKAVAGGTKTIEDAAGKNATAIANQGAAVTTTTDDSTQKIDDYNDAVKKSATTTQASTQSGIDSWGKYTSALSSDVDDIMAKIAALIKAMAGVGTLPTGGASTGGAGTQPSAQSNAASGGGVYTINVLVNGQYQESVSLR